MSFIARNPNFLKTISGYIDSAPGKITKEQSPIPADVVGTTTEIVRSQFFSVNSRQYAEYLVDLYKKADQKAKSQIVSALLGAIIPPKDDEKRRYRVNLYIALTFSLLPNSAMGDPDLQRLKALKSYAEYNDENDKTFRLDVDNALAKQGATSRDSFSLY